MERHDPTVSPGERRALLRSNPSLARELEHLAQRMPGASAERPIEVSSASQVDGRAESTPCPLCGGPLRMREHSVRWLRSVPIRVVEVRCRMCGTDRALHYRVRTAHA